MLDDSFFDRDALDVAQDLIGKVIRRRLDGRWLAVAIVEVEAYFIREKGSHASLGKTKSREALFMPAGTIYMYYARGGDSLNVSCRGDGNAVLIKSGLVHVDRRSPEAGVEVMHRLNPIAGRRRPRHRLCSGQTLVCRSLALSVPEWNGRRFDRRALYIEDVGRSADELIQARRLGIPEGRDEHLLYRFIDFERRSSATQDPIGKRGWREGEDYTIRTCR
jgi:DNA-3-methyladenine glycosylase